MIILGPTETYYADGDERVEFIVIDGGDVFMVFKATPDKQKHVRHFVEEPMPLVGTDDLESKAPPHADDRSASPTRRLK
jgi:hypothetical protein